MSLDAKTNLQWREAARESFHNPKLLRSRYWKRYNTITIPLQKPKEFYADALEAAWQSFSREELEGRLEARRRERAQDMEKLIYRIWNKADKGNSANIEEAAADILRHGSLSSMLRMISGFMYGWTGPDTTPKEGLRARQKEEEKDRSYFYGLPFTMQEIMHMEEHSDEDWDLYKNDDDYCIRECEDSEEELSRWRSSQCHGLGGGGGGGKPPGYEWVDGRGHVPEEVAQADKAKSVAAEKAKLKRRAQRKTKRKARKASRATTQVHKKHSKRPGSSSSTDIDELWQETRASVAEVRAYLVAENASAGSDPSTAPSLSPSRDGDSDAEATGIEAKGSSPASDGGHATTELDVLRNPSLDDWTTPSHSASEEAFARTHVPGYKLDGGNKRWSAKDRLSRFFSKKGENSRETGNSNELKNPKKTKSSKTIKNSKKIGNSKMADQCVMM